MISQLNESGKQYREFYGSNITQMPKLIAAGRTPLSTVDLMRARLSALSASPAVSEAWWNNWFDLGDAIAYHPDGRVKIVLDATVLRTISSKSPIQNGALVLEDGMYDLLPGAELRRNNLGITHQDLNKRQALNNPVWNELAHGDRHLLKEYVNAVFSETKERFGYRHNMGVYLVDAPSVPSVRPWCVFYLTYASRVYGDTLLDRNDGRFIGMARQKHKSSAQRG